MDNLRNRYDYYGLYEEKGTYYQVGGNVFSVEDKKTYSYGRSVSSAYTIDFKKIPNPLKIKVFNTGFNINLTDLRGIECLENLELFVGENNDLADMISLSKCKKLKSVIVRSGMGIWDLEAFLGHPTIKLLYFYCPPTNYEELYLYKLIKKFKKQGIEVKYELKINYNYLKYYSFDFPLYENMIRKVSIKEIKDWCNDNNYVIGKKI